MKFHQGLFGVLLCACLGMDTARAAIESTVVTGGAIKGQVIQGVGVFKGIPFAAAPVGELRWQAPRPVAAWQGVRNANAFAPACIQPWSPTDQPQPSEDCLYLNVWTAATSAAERRPVIVWIHGGGLVGGMSWERVSDGNNLAREGAVVVTIAYRLGALGFLAHSELTRENGKTSGNYGLHDMIAALEWVQQNVARFGGDPERVLAIGGSAGALAVSVLAGSPAARGLYSRAAALGGAAFAAGISDDPKYVFYYPKLEHTEQKGAALFKELGAADTRAARAMPANAVLQATDRGKFEFGITRDGELVQGYNRELFQQGRFNDVPTLIGYTSDEAGEPPPEVTRASAEADLKRTPCKHTHDAIVAAYPPLLDDQQARGIVRRVIRDQNVGWSTWTWARLQTQHGRSPVYAHFFDIHPPDRPHGAPHATEYPYFFGNFLSTPTQRDLAASALIRRYLINFAAGGDPNGAGLPHWEQFSAARQRVMVFDEDSSSREWPSLAALRAFTPLLECFAGIPRW